MRFWDYLRYRRRMLLAAAVCCVIFAASFALYRLPLRAVLYPVGLCLLVGLGFAVWDYRRTLKRHRALTGCGDLTAELLRELPPPESLAEEDYRAQLLHLRQLCTELQRPGCHRVLHHLGAPDQDPDRFDAVGAAGGGYRPFPAAIE